MPGFNLQGKMDAESTLKTIFKALLTFRSSEWTHHYSFITIK
jgi:hypothetical protein